MTSMASSMGGGEFISNAMHVVKARRDHGVVVRFGS